MNRATIICAFVVATAQTTVQITNHTFEICMTITRPYISDSGPRNRGPKVYPSTKTDMERSLVMPPLILSVAAIAGSAGEIIVEDINVTSKKQETRNVEKILFLKRQFLGFVGSAASCQVT